MCIKYILHPLTSHILVWSLLMFYITSLQVRKHNSSAVLWTHTLWSLWVVLWSWVQEAYICRVHKSQCYDIHWTESRIQSLYCRWDSSQLNMGKSVPNVTIVNKPECYWTVQQPKCNFSLLLQMTQLYRKKIFIGI